MNNVIDEPAYSEIRKELKLQLENLRKEYKDSDKLDKIFIEISQKR